LPSMRLALLVLAIYLLAGAAATTYSSRYTKSLGVFYPDDATRTGQANLLFRSNVPEDGNKKFLYDRLLQEMVSKAATERKVFVRPENVYMVVVSLVGSSSSILKDENQYFDKHPQRGEHVNMPILGERDDPAKYDEDHIMKKVKSVSWMKDDLDQILAFLHNRVTDFSTKRNVFVVFHCQHGHDRTGEVAAAWGLRYGLMNWKQVNALNYEIGLPLLHSHIQFPNQRALTWYCFYLQYHSGYDDLGCTVVSTNNHNTRKPNMLDWDESDSSQAWLASVIVLSVIVFLAVAIIGIMACCLFCCWRKNRRIQFEALHEETEVSM